MMGHRSLYHDGWRAVCPWPGTSFVESGMAFGTPITYDRLTELDAKGWELYNLTEDFAETNNLADNEKARLIAMIGMWYNEAGSTTCCRSTAAACSASARSGPRSR